MRHQSMFSLLRDDGLCSIAAQPAVDNTLILPSSPFLRGIKMARSLRVYSFNTLRGGLRVAVNGINNWRENAVLCTSVRSITETLRRDRRGPLRDSHHAS